MYLCYIDESGTSAVPGNTSHFVLAGVSIPIWHWKQADSEITTIATRYGLKDAELHTAWLLRPYLEQRQIQNFEALDTSARRTAVHRERTKVLLNLQKSNKTKHYNQTRKNYKHTESYVHLTFDERVSFVRDIAGLIGGWGYARLFAECIDKTYFDPTRSQRSIDEQAFEQIVSRFEKYLQRTETANQRNYGLLVHDNNQTVAKKHTDMMRQFHNGGTLWTNISRIIETPLFVDSKLTSMVQVADLCCYAVRRYLENQESDLFDRIFPRADKIGGYTVGVRHWSDQNCQCRICQTHRSR